MIKDTAGHFTSYPIDYKESQKPGSLTGEDFTLSTNLAVVRFFCRDKGTQNKGSRDGAHRKSGHLFGDGITNLEHLVNATCVVRQRIGFEESFDFVDLCGRTQPVATVHYCSMHQ